MEVYLMSCYSLTQVYDLIKPLDPSIPSIEEFIQLSIRLKFEPELSLIYQDASTVQGYVMVGMSGNQIYVIDYKFYSISVFDGFSIFLNFINKQRECFPRIKLLKMTVSKKDSISDYLEDNDFVCRRLLTSYEMRPNKEKWKEDTNIKLVKEKVSLEKLRKMRIKENTSLMVPYYLNDDEMVCNQEHYGLYVGENNPTKIGYLCADTKGGVKQLFILPSCRRKGFATSALKDYCYRFLKCSEASIRFEHVDTSYEPMVSFLKNLGFTLYSEEEKEYVKSLQ